MKLCNRAILQGSGRYSLMEDTPGPYAFPSLWSLSAGGYNYNDAR
jgi:hypothetical protein